jgi:hypothetical protein
VENMTDCASKVATIEEEPKIDDDVLPGGV